MIKLIAALTMLVDHVGYVLFPNVLWLRLVGRLSMPLYAYCVAQGCFYTALHGSRRRYVTRMAVLAFASQLPFYCASGNPFYLNICFTWLAAIAMISIFERFFLKKRALLCATLLFGVACFLELLSLLGRVSVDYGLYGVLLPLLFYVLIVSGKESSMNYLLVLLFGCLVYATLQGGNILQLASVLSAGLLAVRKRFDVKVKLPRWVFYWFYPVHLFILVGIRALVR